MNQRTGKPSEVYQRVVIQGEALVTVIPEGADPNYWHKILKNHAYQLANPKPNRRRSKTAKERGVPTRNRRYNAEQILDRRNAEW